MLSSSACLLASLGDEGLFNSENILQIADVVRWVLFLLFLLCFQLILRPFLPRETGEMSLHFVLTTKTIQPRPQVFLVNYTGFWQLCCRIDVIFHISLNSSKFGQQRLVIMKYPWDFSQSETEKYFELTIMFLYMGPSFERLISSIVNHA